MQMIYHKRYCIFTCRAYTQWYMSVIFESGVADVSPTSGNGELGEMKTVLESFRKLKADLGFLPPVVTDNKLDRRLVENDTAFDEMIRDYVGAWMAEQEYIPHVDDDITPFRGLLVAVAELYYERQYGRRPVDKPRSHLYREYLRAVEEDLRDQGDPVSLGSDLANMYNRHAQTHRQLFGTNVMRILVKMDPNLVPIVRR